MDFDLPIEPDLETYELIIQKLSAIFAETLNKVDINYADESVEQQIINTIDGLILESTDGEITTTFQVKPEGLYLNGELLNTSYEEFIVEIGGYENFNEQYFVEFMARDLKANSPITYTSI
ncbi:MAG: hypothetical protein EOM18_10435, partial [Clostridia bacterium]|nr:hypothetical protein [Clostridia bacterium]